MKCLIHLVSKDPGKLVPFSDTSWTKVVSCAKEWILLEAEEKRLCEIHQVVFAGSLEEATSTYGYHRKCYSRFTDKSKLERAIKRNQQPVPKKVDKTPTSKKRLRSASTIHTHISTSQAVQSGSVLPLLCLICKKKDHYMRVGGKSTKTKLVKAETFDAGRLREAATAKEDESILRHIRDKDCVAIEVQYHSSCYKQYIRFLSTTSGSISSGFTSEPNVYERTFVAFCEIVRKRIIHGKEILRMSKLLDIFVKMAIDLEGVDISNYSTYSLKRRLKARFPQLKFHSSSKQFKSEMVFVDDMTHGDILEKLASSSDTSESTDTDDDATLSIPRHSDVNTLHTLYSAAMLLRQQFNETQGYQGPWPPTANDLSAVVAKSIIPIPLFNMIAWIVGESDEPTIDSYVPVEEEANRKLMSIIQDMIYLQSKGKKQTPKSLCLGLTIRHLSGSKIILDILNKFGHSSSHKTIVRLDTSLAQMQLDKGSVFIPDGFSKNLNTLLVWDNIDFCEETISGHGTTHHTNGISVQCKVMENQSETSDRVSMPRIPVPFKPTATALVPYFPRKRKGPHLTDLNEEYIQLSSYKAAHYKQHLIDLAFVILKCFDEGINHLPGWTGFNTLLCNTDDLVKSDIAYLPVIEASPTEMDTVNTILSRSIEMADKLELETVTVVFDLTIYAKAQEIRWNNETYYQRLIVRLGEFHTCMSFMSIIGKRFKDAGLSDVLVEAEIVASGSLNSVLEGKQYNRSIYAHKLMFEALHRLKLKMFTDSLPEEYAVKMKIFLHHMTSSFPSPLFKDLYQADEFLEIVTAYEEFDKTQCSTNKTFSLWNSYLEMVEILLSFVRATRESDWNLHVASIRSMLPWYFAYDKTHYARYLPAYWMEMVNLENTHPVAYNQLTQKGQWTVQQQSNYGFSATACDQTIEQTCNRDTKTSGGITGFTLNRNAVQRWILSQNHRAEIHHQCENLAGISQESRTRKDLDLSRKKREEESIVRLIDTMEQMVNPFSTDHTGELVSINSGVIANDDVSSDMMNAYSKGEEAVMAFFRQRLTSDDVPFHNPIKQMKLKTFSTQQKVKTKTKSGTEIILQSDRKLFSRLLILSQQKSIDLREVLTHSLGPVSYPLASSNGSLGKTNKAALLHLIESKSPESIVETIPTNSALIFDGMALIQSLPKQLPSTFGELADLILLRMLTKARHFGCHRLDFVIDQYPEISIKNAERSRRASKGMQSRHIYGKDQKIPQQWAKYLASGTNKTSLVEFLYSIWQNIGKDILGHCDLFITHGNLCHKITVENDEILVVKVDELCCDHEEADTRLLLHAKHASDICSNIIVMSPDTDVAIIILGFVEEITSTIYFYTGVKNKIRMINMQTVFHSLGRGICHALIGLHVFTGCDSTSCFHGKGKKKPYDLMASNPFYQNMFTNLGKNFVLSPTLFTNLENFVCKLYGQSVSDINEARYKMFCLSTASEQTLPPTRDALLQHTKRANFQAAIHRHSLQAHIDAPSPESHGWNLVNNNLSIVWMDMDPAPSSILQNVYCKCHKSCETKRCSCKTANVSCTDLCGCVNCFNCKPTDLEEPIDFVSSDEED